MKLQNIIKTNNFGFLIAVGAVIVQALHTQYVLKLVSSLGDYAGWHSMIVALLISSAILYFTLRGRTRLAIFWACFESYMNICYYSIFIMTQDNPPTHLFWIAIPSAIALPTILGFFADELVKDEQDIAKVADEIKAEFEEIKEKITALEEKDGEKLSDNSNEVSSILSRVENFETKFDETISIVNKELGKRVPKGTEVNLTINNQTYKVKLN